MTGVQTCALPIFNLANPITAGVPYLAMNGKVYSQGDGGNGSLDECRASLWAAITQAADELTASLGPDPAQWRTTAARTSFAPGLIPDTMRATNRPTFQQVLELAHP